MTRMVWVCVLGFPEMAPKRDTTIIATVARTNIANMLTRHHGLYSSFSHTGQPLLRYQPSLFVFFLERERERERERGGG